MDKMHTLLKAEAEKNYALDKLFHLLEEMTNITDRTIIWLIQYCDKHNIPLKKETQLKSYVNLSRRILKEIEEKSMHLKELIKYQELANPIRRFFTEDESDDKLPVPEIIRFNR